MPEDLREVEVPLAPAEYWTGEKAEKPAAVEVVAPCPRKWRAFVRHIPIKGNTLEVEAADQEAARRRVKALYPTVQVADIELTEVKE